MARGGVSPAETSVTCLFFLFLHLAKFLLEVEKAVVLDVTPRCVKSLGVVWARCALLVWMPLGHCKLTGIESLRLLSNGSNRQSSPFGDVFALILRFLEDEVVAYDRFSVIHDHSPFWVLGVSAVINHVHVKGQRPVDRTVPRILLYPFRVYPERWQPLAFRNSLR